MMSKILMTNNVSESDRLKKIERIRSRARHDEAQALYATELRGEQRRDEHWQDVVAESVVAESVVDMKHILHCIIFNII